jgi:hypothetical protein
LSAAAGTDDAVEAALAEARKVADAVLYEGYLLYPYRASAQKNQLRWQFGVLAPRAWSEAGGGDPWRSRTETLIEADDGCRVQFRLRGLQLETRPEDGWDEGVEREVEAVLTLPGSAGVDFELPGGPGRHPVRGRLSVSAERLPGPYGVVRLRADVENHTDCDPAVGRNVAARRSLVGTHLLIGSAGAKFLSLADPPEWARPFADGCANEHTWPVLLGNVILSSPIILADHAQVAPESQGDMFDGTEIDEILSLRTIALTEEEKAEARATDPRAAAIMDRLDSMPAEVWERLHGAIRSLRPVDPAPATVLVAGGRVGPGRRVRLHPRGGDAQDMFLAGRTAVVETVLDDLDGTTHVAVSVEDDPRTEMLQSQGRFFYFHPEEIEPL